MKTLLVTGGIGSGKSIVCKHIDNMGYPIYNCDDRAKALYDEDPELLNNIETAFGESLRGEDGKLDRKKLASIIFSDPGKKQKLEEIVHPALREDFDLWRCGQESDLVIIESAIAMGNPFFRDAYDASILVTSPLDDRLRRVEERDNATEDEVRKRMNSQEIDEDGADFIIDNSSDLKALYSKVNEVIYKFI